VFENFDKIRHIHSMARDTTVSLDVKIFGKFKLNTNETQ